MAFGMGQNDPQNQSHQPVSGAILQTCSALPDLAEYLLDVKGLIVVLLGMINSDPL
jgi:hypothetical protein